MSENIIYCYSGFGHCLNMAKSIASRLGDTDIVLMRSFPEKTDATEAKRERFPNPGVKAMDLTKKLIHIN